MREQNDQEELKKYFKIERPSCLSLLLERGGGEVELLQWPLVDLSY